MLASGTNILGINSLIPIENLHIGDSVIDHCGRIVAITNMVSKPECIVLATSFADFRHIYTTRDEILNTTIYTKRQGRINYPLTVENILTAPRRKYQYGKDLHMRPLHVDSPNKDLLVDPYLLGTLIGDGYLTSKRIMLSTDLEIIKNVESSLPAGTILRLSEREPKGTCHWASFTSDTYNEKSPLTIFIQELGLADKRGWEKFIPPDYLFGSYDQRLALIQGLMDTDGYAPLPGGSVVYTTTSEQLMNDFVYLIRSLGGMTKHWVVTPLQMKKWNGVQSKIPTYRCSIRMPYPGELFRLTRKKSRVNHANQYSNRFNIRVGEICPIEEKKTCYGITLDRPDSLIVSDAFIGLNQYKGG